MNAIKKLFFCTLVLFGLQFGLGGCVAEVGGGGGPWYHDGPWLDGGGRGRVDVDIHPPGRRR